MSLQNLQRAVNALPPSALSETDRAFTEVVKRSRDAVEPFVPKQITDGIYRGRQGDAAEFVQLLFLACPSIANAIFQGAETTYVLRLPALRLPEEFAQPTSELQLGAAQSLTHARAFDFSGPGHRL